MDMWNWLHECYDQNCLTLKELEDVLDDDRAAHHLWDDFAEDSGDFIEWVRDEVKPFIRYIQKREKEKQDDE